MNWLKRVPLSRNDLSSLSKQLVPSSEVYSMHQKLTVNSGEAIKHPTCSHYTYTSTQLRSHQTQANQSCSPSFVIAGFMKSGTTYLYDLIAQHPQVLKALRGVVFKETGCYLPDELTPRRIHRRMQCFPFVEDGEVNFDRTINFHVT